jgi:hypothetical protein
MVAGQIHVLHALAAGQAPCNCMPWQVRPLFALPVTACYGGVTCMQHIACSCRLHDLQYSIDLGHRPILSMSFTGASTIFSFASGVGYVPIGCRHTFCRYWQRLLSKTTTKCSLQHPENEHQRSINSFTTGICCDQGVARMFACITVLSTALRGKNTIYRG